MLFKLESGCFVNTSHIVSIESLCDSSNPNPYMICIRLSVGEDIVYRYKYQDKRDAVYNHLIQCLIEVV